MTLARQEVSHPNIVKVYGGAVIWNGQQHVPVLVMERVHGPNGDSFLAKLERARADHRVTESEYRAIQSDFAEAMTSAAAHLAKAGIVHRDIKPSNVVVDQKTGRFVVVDFGVWSEAHMSGSRGGTRNFAPPESLAGGVVDARTDSFSIGATTVESVDYGHRNLYDPRKNRLRVASDGAPIGEFRRNHLYGQRVQKNLNSRNAYVRFTSHMMKQHRTNRSSPEAAIANEPYLSDGLHHQINTAKVVQELLDPVKPRQPRRIPEKQATATQEATWRRMARSLKDTPDLFVFRDLKRASKEYASSNARNFTVPGILKVRTELKSLAMDAFNKIMLDFPWINTPIELTKGVTYILTTQQVHLKSKVAKRAINQDGEAVKSPDNNERLKALALSDSEIYAAIQFVKVVKILDLFNFIIEADQLLPALQTASSEKKVWLHQQENQLKVALRNAKHLWAIINRMQRGNEIKANRDIIVTRVSERVDQSRHIEQALQVRNQQLSAGN